jgi:ArsR family transcriptional regulator, arsenate/arsenite/antimonite-responsive transcriptional repressor
MDIYRALSDPTRRRILSLLARSEKTQSQIVEQFYISQPAITKHLKILKEEGLIGERRVGRVCYYMLNQTSFEQAYSAMRVEIEQMLDRKLQSFKRYLEEGEDE